MAETSAERSGDRGFPCVERGYQGNDRSRPTRKEIRHYRVQRDAEDRARVEKLFKDGKTEAEVVAARPLNDLDAKWAANDETAVNFLKMVYNSFKRS
jgi:hypothetical protein